MLTMLPQPNQSARALLTNFWIHPFRVLLQLFCSTFNSNTPFSSGLVGLVQSQRASLTHFWIHPFQVPLQLFCSTFKGNAPSSGLVELIQSYRYLSTHFFSFLLWFESSTSSSSYPPLGEKHEVTITQSLCFTPQLCSLPGFESSSSAFSYPLLRAKDDMKR